MAACPIPNEIASALTHCRRERCRDACVPCGGIFDYFGEAECGGCVATSCCDQALACVDDASCAAFLTCAEACGTSKGPICLLECQGRYPEANDLHDFIRICTGACATACGAGADLSCAYAYDVPLADGGTITDPTLFVDFLTKAPVPGIVVDACNPVDIACADPISTAVTDENGVATHVLPAGFTGFYSATPDGAFPTIIDFPYPLLFDRDERNQLVLGLDLQAPFEQLIGATLEPGKAHIAFQTIDCIRSWAPGVAVRVEPDDGATIFYLDNGIPVAGATATIGESQGGILNVAPVPVRLIGTVEATGEQLFDHVVRTRPDTFTQIELTPSPR